MIAAVSAARTSADVHTAPNCVGPAASTCAALAAWERPRSLNSMSAEPCHFAIAFHRLCPWRTTRSEETAVGTPTRVPGPRRASRCPARPQVASPTIRDVPVIRLFAAAREAAGTGRDELAGATVGEVLDAAVDRYGSGFAAVLNTCRVWVDGEPADRSMLVGDGAEVAVLPPVSGGA
jgi:molybdopterin synthase sulfur carrier subunit